MEDQGLETASTENVRQLKCTLAKQSPATDTLSARIIFFCTVARKLNCSYEHEISWLNSPLF